METPPETEADLAGATKRVAWRLLAICHNRAELLMVEMQEERERARAIIILASTIAVLGLLAGGTITALIVCAAGAHMLLALIILAILYTAGAVIFYLKLDNMKRDWEPLSGTREQLEKDRECFEKTLL
jgi:uncharacterized membrane protein YqjE